MAINPMLALLNQNKINTGIQPIKQMMNSIKMAGNPQAALSQMMANNPMYAQAMKLVQESGGDARAAFYSLAQKQGIDPEQILSQLK